VENSESDTKKHFWAFNEDYVPKLNYDLSIKTIAEQTSKPLKSEHRSRLEPAIVEMLH
jgi:hypothetical protein